MTTVEISKIKEAMRRLGASSSQINSSTVDKVLMAMQQEDVDAQAFYREQILNEKKELTYQRYEYERAIREARDAKKEYDKTAAEIRADIAKEVTKREEEISRREKELKQREDAVAEKEKLYANIEQCETPEARDKIRLAEYFSENTQKFSKTKIYEERFMPGLSNILGNGGARSTQGGISQMEEITAKAKKR